MSGDLERTRERALLRQFARDRGGGNPAREVDSLKARSADGAAEALLLRYETTALTHYDTASLTAPSGASGVAVRFMYGVSGYGGDGYGA